MRVTILILALIVGGYVVDDGYPSIGYFLVGIAFWEAVFERSWKQDGHWGRVALRRGFVCVFYVGLVLLAVIAHFR